MFISELFALLFLCDWLADAGLLWKLSWSSKESTNITSEKDPVKARTFDGATDASRKTLSIWSCKLEKLSLARLE